MHQSEEAQQVFEGSLPVEHEIDMHLGYSSIKALSRPPWRRAIVDRLEGRRALSAGMLLSVAAALARRWKATIPERRVGIALPPGLGATVANLALVLIDKVAVNLNFTLGKAACEACIRQAEIRVLISSPLMKEKVPQFPWPEATLDVREEIKACGKASILGWLPMIWSLPARLIARKLGTPATGGRREAALLFTSGSSGDPKGVVLSHCNIQANVAQIHATGLLRGSDVLLGNLPVFHSFGFTGTLWYPLLKGAGLVTVPSPLEVRKAVEAVKEEKVSVLIGTPTFLRPYLKKAEGDELANLRLVVAGAEKTSRELMKRFRERFGVSILEGYGITETSPVVSVNVPEVAAANGRRTFREGSVGKLLPGIAARIVDPETFDDRSPTECGLLLLRGPNVFEGYLNNPKATEESFFERWYITGDLACFDKDGFLYIQGRNSRFSKIGGEMVSHGAIEEALLKIHGWQEEEENPVAVMGVSDPAKGESLVLLTTRDVSREDLRKRLSEAGYSNLWLPRKVRKVDGIPCLASGKLDLRKCRELAPEAK